MKTVKLTFAALAFALAAAPAHADDSLTARAVSAIGVAIASQGNAALLQIRAELKEQLLERLRPQLPAPEPEDRARTAQPEAPSR